jgi:DNA recombination protein RmuC
MQLASSRQDDPSSSVQPLIDGPAAYLWSGAGAVLLLMILAFLVLMRVRVGRRRGRKGQAASTDYFQPAGDNAEITFEDPRAAAARNVSPVDAIPAPFDENLPLARDKKPGPFAGLFARRKQREDEQTDAPPVEAAFDAAADDMAVVSIERNPLREASLDEPFTASRSPFAEPKRDPFDARNEDRARTAPQDDYRPQPRQSDYSAPEPVANRWAEQRLAEPANTEARIPDRWAPEPRDEDNSADFVASTLSEVEEALHAQSETIKFETRSALDHVSRRLENQIASLGARLDARERSERGGASQDDRRDLIREFSELLAEQRASTAAQLRALGDRLDAFDAARLSATTQANYNGPTAFAAPEYHLADVIRDCLPPGAYQLNAALSNNQRADCLIRLPHPLAPIAIDAKFPVEAFQLLEEKREDADNEFRRIALRHIVDIAERLIAPNETADAALMFTPSETMNAALQARFPDVVQDAYRARVWIVSPTSLMATLNAIRAVVGDPRAKQAQALDASKALAEVDMLRDRVARLEADFERARRDATEPAASSAWRRDAPAPVREPHTDILPRPILFEPGDQRGDLDRDPVDREPQAPFPLR